MSILPPHLDPYAVGDYDTRCDWCGVNLDNAPSGVSTCPGRTPDARTKCSDCCTAYCCADLNVPTRNPVSAATPPTQNHASASSDPVAALTNTIAYHVEACDSCSRAYASNLLTPVTDADGLMELRCPACVERLREELRDFGLSA